MPLEMFLIIVDLLIKSSDYFLLLLVSYLFSLSFWYCYVISLENTDMNKKAVLLQSVEKNFSTGKRGSSVGR